MPNQNALLYHRHIEKRSNQYNEIMTELGYDSLLIHSGCPELRLFDDQHPPFRAHAPFVALIPQPFAADCLLELRVGRTPRLWFSQPRDFWHLTPESPAEWWAGVLDIEVVAGPEGWHDRFRDDRPMAVLGRERDLGSLIGTADLNPPKLIARLDELRTRKTAWERQCIAMANKTAASAHMDAGAAFESGASELEIHLAYLAAARQDQDELPYNSIVALNDHAAVLHYQFRSPTRPADSRSFLIDAGAHYFGYAADVTRTWTRPEHSEFDDLIELVDSAQQQLCARVRTGVSFVDLHRQAHIMIASVLEQSGLVRMAPEAMVDAGISSYFLPHGLGHFIGVQVHDVAGKVSNAGEPLPPPDQYPSLRLTRELEVGHVLTIEPGLYFIPMLLDKLRDSQFSKQVDWMAIDRLKPFGGIRIEDNVLVTEAEPVNFTRQAFAMLA
ncbi:MAG: Xaa-Pro dipeptidase [Wenzhouxiangella sp.]